ncbi:hypothetical protein, partial [Infirmifilum sp.]|uniref:hypothetical protein n=1 Tax=Infirmifilum sp. TaxID=2856575 RepID=UPI003D13E53D
LSNMRIWVASLRKLIKTIIRTDTKLYQCASGKASLDDGSMASMITLKNDQEYTQVFHSPGIEP